MTETITNRRRDEIRIGQLWTDVPRRTSRRTLRVDGFEAAGHLGTRVACTVIRSRDTDTGPGAEPGRVAGDQGRQSPHHCRRQGLSPHRRG